MVQDAACVSVIDNLRDQSLANIRKYFSGLNPPQFGSMIGYYRGVFVGPAWLIPLWKPTLAIAGLGGWWGKRIDQEGDAFNLVFTKGIYEERFPMVMVEEESYLDGRSGRAFHYSRENPFPWPLIIDELRRIDDQHVLGMTLAKLSPLSKIGFPFVLQYREKLDE